MKRQLTLRIPAALASRLERATMQMRRPRSDVVRLALEEFLGGAAGHQAARPVDLARDLIGSVQSGIPDLGQRHREYLLRHLRRGP